MNRDSINAYTTTGITTSIGGFVSQVYGWMTLGLFSTAGVAFAIYFLLSTSQSFGVWLFSNSWIFMVALVLQLVLVLTISFGIEKLSSVFAAGLFIVYSALMGITLFGILAQYSLTSVAIAFGITGGTFLVMSAIGYFTNRDLTSLGSLGIMGIVGLIIGSIINIFLRSTGFDLLLTYAGIFIFLILIAYNTQQVKKFAALAEQTGNTTKYALIAALNLYLDFINLFLRILSLTGRRK